MFSDQIVGASVKPGRQALLRTPADDNQSIEWIGDNTIQKIVQKNSWAGFLGIILKFDQCAVIIQKKEPVMALFVPFSYTVKNFI
ncbi:hypothetical protein D3C80_504700 [compost metagenome]